MRRLEQDHYNSKHSDRPALAMLGHSIPHKFHHSISSPFLKYCWIHMAVNKAVFENCFFINCVSFIIQMGQLSLSNSERCQMSLNATVFIFHCSIFFIRMHLNLREMLLLMFCILSIFSDLTRQSGGNIWDVGRHKRWLNNNFICVRIDKNTLWLIINFGFVQIWYNSYHGSSTSSTKLCLSCFL